MARVTPVRIGKRRPHVREGSPHGLATDIRGAAHVRTGRRIEAAVVGHESHEGLDIVAIPRVGERLQHLHRHNVVRHVLLLSDGEYAASVSVPRGVLASRLEGLIVRGVGVSWVAALPIAGLQAMYMREREDLLAAVADKLVPIEATKRLGWQSASEYRLGDGALYWMADDLAILGFIAGRNGAAAVDELRAALAASGATTRGEELVSAVLAAPSLLATLGADFPSPSRGLDEVIDVASATFRANLVAAEWSHLLGAALHARDRDAQLRRLLDAMLAAARANTATFVEAIVDPTPEPTAVRERLTTLVSTLSPADRKDGTKRRAVARYLRDLAAAGDTATVAIACNRVVSLWGTGAGWEREAFSVYCAAHLVDAARKLVPSPRAHAHVELVAALARVGSESDLSSELERLLDRAALCTNVVLSEVLGEPNELFDEAISPVEVARLAPVLQRLRRDPAPLREQLLDALTSLPSAEPVMTN